MMGLARRASLLVAFYLLTSAATAYAECAWVLWEERTAVGGRDARMFGPDDPGRWQIAEGVPSLQACYELKAAKYKFWESLAVASEKPGSAVEISIFGKLISSRNKVVPTDFAAWSYICFPDTMDPRAPKLSGR